MNKKATRQASKPPSSTRALADEEKDLSTLSVRFTDEQRKLLVEAAGLRGWTATALIRTAALERALHIVNTSRLTKFDFKGLASEIALRLFQQRMTTYVPTEDELDSQYGEVPGEISYDVPVPPLPLDMLFKFKKAAELGGKEFLDSVIAIAESLTASQRQDLPDPLDPTKVDSR